MGVWLKDPSPLMLYPEFTVSLMASEPEWWLMQVPPGGYIKFDHWLELPGLGTPIKDLGILSNTDWWTSWDEHDREGAATYFSNSPLPTSKVWPHRQISLTSWPSPEPAPSTLKKHRWLEHSILHRSGRTLAILPQRWCMTLVSNAQLVLFPDWTHPSIFEYVSQRCGLLMKYGKWDCSSSCCCTPATRYWNDK